MEIRYDRAAAKYLQGLQKKTKYSIRQAIIGLTKKPPEGDIKKMQGYKDGRYRLRVGKYRIIYRYTNEPIEESKKDVVIDILLIMDIGSRGDIYK